MSIIPKRDLTVLISDERPVHRAMNVLAPDVIRAVRCAETLWADEWTNIYVVEANDLGAGWFEIVAEVSR